ncbi:sarcosine oxidase subunit alpha [Cognatiyoonia sediminum]|uniref:Sarcosine oxidase subunit alpha n=1 Tax=Cognatiyoonia sediminum TaxID=1508389 RepID=A0A1M5SF92_9RHOB|nr:2Fe-2S iron-sulfur cluster-binding protein [Cognatiyoonia sediminum]SHH36553.1 sarcosine oxidase subunit alpha [Cognatiyoonia sediminum]
MTTRRLNSGGLIDRSKPISFWFDGKTYEGFEGDTLASALLANGVSIVGRSFKYHRPRGVWSAWVDEPNAIMNIRLNGKEQPNCLATTTYIEEGMAARSVNAFPTAKYDIKGGLDLFHRFLGAGFYYKTFIWPDWHLFEPAIRKMAGLGAVDREVLEDFQSAQNHAKCDVLVVGGGAAGLTAARAAAEAGKDVVLVDDQRVLGGSLYRCGATADIDPDEWVAAQKTAIENAGGRILTHTTAYGVYDHGLVALVQSQGFGRAPALWRMRAGQVIMATGALDRPITFAKNDLPGTMSLNAAGEYLARYGVMAANKPLVMRNNSHASATIENLRAAGSKVEEIDHVDGITNQGRKHTTGLRIGKDQIDADGVLVSGGLTPLVHLWRHAGGKLDWCETRQAFVPKPATDAMIAIGAANGTYDLAQAIEEAEAAGKGTPIDRPSTTYTTTLIDTKPHSKGRQWIDFQHDVTLKDIEVAARENYVSVEHLKRYTTLGMAFDQGKTSNMAGLTAMAALRGKPIPQVGTTTFRPPFVPVPLEIYHGAKTKQLWSPVKRLPLEDKHRDLDAAFCEYGGWLRPGWYGSGDRDATIQKEAKAARDTAGIFDGSTLGKIEVMGPDAEAFLNFVYYNTIKSLKPGGIRYGFMLTEGGIVYDDGVVTRVDQNRFIVSCSSSHVDGVRTHLEAWRQDGNDPDRIFVHDQTTAWATVTVTGPKARDVLSSLDTTIDLAPDAFPHMTFREGTMGAIPLRIARVSFSGDLSYEVSVPTGHAETLWNAITAAGKEQGVSPIGLEAMSILRAEKGFIIIGKDTDGETMPHDLGFTIPRAKKKAAFIGDRSLHTEKANADDRKVLVGLSVPDGEPPLATGAHAFTETPTRRSLGYVTSSYQSPNVGPIALAIIEAPHAKVGDTIKIWHKEEVREVTICDPCRFDSEGGRLHA